MSRGSHAGTRWYCAYWRLLENSLKNCDSTDAASAGYVRTYRIGSRRIRRRFLAKPNECALRLAEPCGKRRSLLSTPTLAHPVERRAVAPMGGGADDEPSYRPRRRTRLLPNSRRSTNYGAEPPNAVSPDRCAEISPASASWRTNVRLACHCATSLDRRSGGVPRAA